MPIANIIDTTQITLHAGYQAVHCPIETYLLAAKIVFCTTTAAAIETYALNCDIWLLSCPDQLLLSSLADYKTHYQLVATPAALQQKVNALLAKTATNGPINQDFLASYWLLTHELTA